MKFISEEEVIWCRDEAARQGFANSSFQKILDKGHEIYLQGWRPIYMVSDDDGTISVAREEPDMTRAN